MSFEGLTGRGVRVGIIDSGVNPAHPHVGPVAGGVFIGPYGQSPEYLDRLGHGTAVAGAIREGAPDALIYAIKVFDRTLLTSSAIILQGIEWCLENEMHVVNLSLGTRNETDHARFEELVARAARSGVVLVAAHDAGGQAVLPGCLPMTTAVGLSSDCPRDSYRRLTTSSRTLFYASGYPRPIPGVPQDRNLNGISFAVANMTGFVARVRQANPDASLPELQRILAKNADVSDATPAPEENSLATIRTDYGQT